MKRFVAVVLVILTGCGTILNSGTATVVPPPGATVDGNPGPTIVSKKRPHEVVYPDGRRCIIESHVSAGYVIADVVFWFLLGVLVDAVTSDWKTLDDGSCPGVMID